MTPDVGPFLHHGYNLNNLSRGLLDKAMYLKKDTLGPFVSDKKIFKVFPYMILCKTSDPRAGPFFSLGLQFEQSW